MLVLLHLLSSDAKISKFCPFQFQFWNRFFNFGCSTVPVPEHFQVFTGSMVSVPELELKILILFSDRGYNSDANSAFFGPSASRLVCRFLF
ncbi:unnamed protein product [Meloidogyne enterolobii]|uniref:Uncharacterized protein n=1 Tax=Meloidogyne enterolobii TaxID=390850 RepID=A0ACB0Y7E6_MELEN